MNEWREIDTMNDDRRLVQSKNEISLWTIVIVVTLKKLKKKHHSGNMKNWN